MKRKEFEKLVANKTTEELNTVLDGINKLHSVFKNESLKTIGNWTFDIMINKIFTEGE